MLSRLASLHPRLRRHVLRRRRLLAFLLTAAAVAMGLATLRPPAPATVAVPVAARDLPAGALLRSGDIVMARLPPGARPDGVAGTPVGQTLAAPVRRGEPVTDVRLLGPALTATQPGLVALPVRLTDAAAARLLHVGDRLLLLSTAAETGRATSIADDAVVLALPATEGSGPDSAQPAGRVVVLGVTSGLVGVVASAAVKGFLGFAWDH